MEKVVCLNDSKIDIENLDKLYDELKIPSKFIKNSFLNDDKIYVLIPQTGKRELEYRCSKCGATLIAKWEFIKKFRSILTEVPFRIQLKNGYYDRTGIRRFDYKWDSRHECYGIGGKPIDDCLLYSDDYKDAKLFENQSVNLECQFINEYKQEAKKFANMKHCPICSAILDKSFPYIKTNFFEIDDVDWINECKKSYKKDKSDGFSDESIEKIRCNILKSNASRESERQVIRYNSYLQKCDVSVASKSSKTNITPDFLKKYIMNLLNLETNIMCMSKRLRELYLLQGKIDKDVAYQQGLAIYNFFKEIEAKDAFLDKLKQEKTDYEKQPLSFQTVEHPPMPIKPKMRKANIFNKKKIAALNAQAEADYQSELKKHHIATEECDRQTEKNRIEAKKQKNLEIQNMSQKIVQLTDDLSKAQNELNILRENSNNTPTPAVGKKKIIDDEIAVLEENLKKTFQCRNELYSYNIIFGKYRNIVTLSTFYEYLMAGRCDSLEGANGAYNIFENESRMNAIVIKLDEIEKKLDEIKANQFMIYNKLNLIESSLNSLNRTMKKAVLSLESIETNMVAMNQYLENISNNTDVIAHNTAVTAYYSKVNAELTNALGFMVAMK